MAEWTTEGACIKEGDNPVGFMHNPARAEQVAKEHNKFESVVIALDRLVNKVCPPCPDKKTACEGCNMRVIVRESQSALKAAE